jgi:hypothetical protein
MKEAHFQQKKRVNLENSTFQFRSKNLINQERNDLFQ